MITVPPSEKDSRTFCYYCEQSSPDGKLKADDALIIDRDHPIQHGDYVLASIEQEMVLGRYSCEGGNVFLTPIIAPHGPDIALYGANVLIIGRLVKAWRRVSMDDPSKSTN